MTRVLEEITQFSIQTPLDNFLSPLTCQINLKVKAWGLLVLFSSSTRSSSACLWSTCHYPAVDQVKQGISMQVHPSISQFIHPSIQWEGKASYFSGRSLVFASTVSIFHTGLASSSFFSSASSSDHQSRNKNPMAHLSFALKSIFVLCIFTSLTISSGLFFLSLIYQCTVSSRLLSNRIVSVESIIDVDKTWTTWIVCVTPFIRSDDHRWSMQGVIICDFALYAIDTLDARVVWVCVCFSCFHLFLSFSLSRCMSSVSTSEQSKIDSSNQPTCNGSLHTLLTYGSQVYTSQGINWLWTIHFTLLSREIASLYEWFLALFHSIGTEHHDDSLSLCMLNEGGQVKSSHLTLSLE